MKCTLVLSLAKDVSDLEGDLVGVDRGAFVLAANRRKMKFAIGDFDSVSSEELETVSPFAEEIIHLNPEKDETDTLSALIKAREYGYDEIEIYGGLSKRLDHTLANIILLERDECITCLRDENTLVRVFGPGEYLMEAGYRYASFFSIEDSVITLEGFKYGLDEYSLKKEDIIGISNEISAKYAKIVVLSGKILAIQVNEK